MHRTFLHLTMVLALSASIAWCQGNLGGLTGRIADSSGAGAAPPARALNTRKRCTPLGPLPASPRSKTTSLSALLEANSSHALSSRITLKALLKVRPQSAPYSLDVRGAPEVMST